MLRPWEVRQGRSVLSKLVRSVDLQPLTSLRMLRLCSIERMNKFKGRDSFKQGLHAAQRAMGVTPAKLEATHMGLWGQ